MKRARSSGESITCSPRIPALTAISSNSMQVSSMNVGYFFFMPMGEQPPRIYPVSASSSFICVISTFLFLETAAAFFKSSSISTGMQNTSIPVLSPRVTSVLKTCSAGMPICSAAWSPERLFSSYSYSAVRYAMPALSKSRITFVFVMAATSFPSAVMFFVFLFAASARLCSRGTARIPRISAFWQCRLCARVQSFAC